MSEMKAFLKSIHIENFRSLRDVTLLLKPLRISMWRSLYANRKNLDFGARP